MNYIKENKNLLLKYLYIIISNLIIYIFTNFYLKNSESKDLLMFLILTVVNYIILNYKGLTKFKVYLDFICNFITGIIILLFVKELFIYGTLLFSIFFANNIIFMKSRLSENFFIKLLQYILILIYTLLSMFINIIIFIIL